MGGKRLPKGGSWVCIEIESKKPKVLKLVMAADIVLYLVPIPLDCFFNRKFLLDVHPLRDISPASFSKIFLTSVGQLRFALNSAS
jgi:hypothetical protein